MGAAGVGADLVLQRDKGRRLDRLCRSAGAPQAGLHGQLQHPSSRPPSYTQNKWALLDTGALRRPRAPLLPQQPHGSASAQKSQPCPSPTHHIRIRLVKESLSKDGHHKDVDDEGDKEGYAGLDEEILVSLSDFLLVCTVHLPGLKGRW